jgi:iron-sulfur cluster insertion protein
MNITESAFRRLTSIKKEQGQISRLIIKGGGCSGFNYEFSLSEVITEDDHLINDVLIIDSISLSMLENSTIDYVSDLTGSYFSVKIPEATSYCGCGSSFSL